MESRVPQHIPGVSSSSTTSSSSSSSSSSIMVQPLLDSRVPYGRLQHPLTIYPIDQMKSSHVENDYIDSPAAVCQQPQLLSHNHHSQHHHHPPLPKHHLPTAASTGSTTTTTGTGQHHHHNNHNHNHHHSHNHHHLHHHHHHHHQQQPTHTQDSTHPWISFSGRPSSISSSSSTSSDQRLLDHAAPTPVQDTLASHTSIITTTSSSSSSSTTTTTSSTTLSSSLPLAPLSLGQAPPTSINTVGGGGVQTKLLQLGSSKPAGGTDLKGVLDVRDGSLLPGDAAAKHLLLCERCGKCRCTECTLPRALPSCWVCHQACLCSAQSLVDAATCMCLVKGVFYHCAEDEDGEEGSCADRPCSCGPSHRCARWSFMAVLSLALPCLLCYLPAVGCAKLSQKCYDGARRPGCRCKAPSKVPVVTTAVSSKAAGMPAGIGILGKPASGGIIIGGLDKQAAS